MREEEFYNPPNDDEVSELDELAEQEAFMEASRCGKELESTISFANILMIPRVANAVMKVNSLIAKECQYIDEVPSVTTQFLGTTYDVVYTITDYGLVIKQDTLKEIADAVANTECVISVQPCTDTTTRLSFSYKNLKIVLDYDGE